jgi:sigma-B regulation protein RsbU (phosphoserine phosphatase)
MDTQIMKRFREKLSSQKQNLLDWLQNTPTDTRKINLGPEKTDSVRSRLQALDGALVKADSETLGLCQVCHEYVETGRLEMDFTADVCIDHFSAEQKRQLEMELELSHQLQKALLPRELPEIAGFQLAAFSQPATIVGGDYFDFFRFRDGAQGIAIADVMGKGLPASMLVASLQASLRILGPENVSPAIVVDRLNRLFCNNIQMIRFITLFLAHLDPGTGLLDYCNAGHNPPLIVRPEATGTTTVQWLQPTGAAIGLAENFRFETGRVLLAPGDVLLLYTDGVTEAVDSKDEELGPARLADSVRERLHLNPETLLKQLRQFLQEFTGGTTFSDDLTIVLGKSIRTSTAHSVTH